VRPHGTLIGLLSGALVGGLLALSLGPNPSGPALFRSIILAPLLGLFGLLFDALQAARPDLWRPRYPGRLWLSRPFKIVLFWTICYPLARVAQDALTAALIADPAGLAGTGLSHLAGPPALLLFLIFQSPFGTAFGIGFAILYRATGGR
jgi:hypothetical protein